MNRNVKACANLMPLEGVRVLFKLGLGQFEMSLDLFK
jgi:hypothetical protein